MSDSIKVKKEGPILEITIDRPKANAIDSKTSIILGDVFTDFRDNPDLCVAILTGAGEKFFSAGWDLKAASEGEAPDADYGVAHHVQPGLDISYRQRFGGWAADDLGQPIGTSKFHQGSFDYPFSRSLRIHGSLDGQQSYG